MLEIFREINVSPTPSLSSTDDFYSGVYTGLNLEYHSTENVTDLDIIHKRNLESL